MSSQLIICTVHNECVGLAYFVPNVLCWQTTQCPACWLCFSLTSEMPDWLRHTLWFPCNPYSKNIRAADRKNSRLIIFLIKLMMMTDDFGVGRDLRIVHTYYKYYYRNHLWSKTISVHKKKQQIHLYCFSYGDRTLVKISLFKWESQRVPELEGQHGQQPLFHCTVCQ